MNKQYSRALISGAKWAMIATWYNRILGLVSTLILARLLTPADFGIVAISSFFIYLFLAFTSVGTNRIVILEDEISEESLNSIWSLNLVLRIACACLLFLSAPWIAVYTNEERVELVIQVVAVIPFLMAFRNIGLEVYEKQLNFKTTTVISIAAKTIGTVCSIAIAIIWQNYWAMVIAVIFSNIIEVVIGYRVCSYRPRWSTSLWKKQWHFSKWLYLTTISGYLRSRIDVMILSSQLNSRTFGIYSFAQELAWLPYSDVVEPLNRGSFAVLSKLKYDHKAFCQTLYQQLAVLMFVVMPCAFGVSVISDPFVRVILGPQWLDAIPVMSNLAGLMVVMTVYMPLTVVLTIKNKMHILFAADVVIVALISLMLYLSVGSSIEVISFNRLLIGLFFLLLMFGLYSVVVGLNFIHLLSIVLLPLSCSWVMYETVDWIINLINNSLYQLIVGIVSGAFIYTAATMFVVYFLKGRITEFQVIVGQLKRQASQRLGMV
ncbi:oligosaccharide flippase family protein [Photobacterium alginatilyticum]|uniref:oligosaccharide flippase family protein n=1 Tax=Photobacterium alginatilyticum TaxID=1775171 RepID=UPI004067CECB